MNSLNVNPTQLFIYDPITNRKTTYLFIGTVPDAVFKSIQRLTSNTELSGRDVSILQEWYGKSWKSKLMPSMSGGGEDAEDIFEKLAAGVIQSDDNIIARSEFPLEDGAVRVTRYNIFPEDTIANLIDKITIATNIPYYRQHMWYYIDGVKTYNYTISTDVDIYNDIMSIAGLANADELIAAGIQYKLYEWADRIKITAYEHLRKVSELDSMKIWIVDMNSYVVNLMQNKDNLIGDKYKMDLLYYNFIILYWPQVSREVATMTFQTSKLAASQIASTYPNLSKKLESLLDVYDAQDKIIYDIYSKSEKVQSLNQSLKIAIINNIMYIEPILEGINLRNLFDKLLVTRCIPAIKLYTTVDNIKYKVLKTHKNVMSEIVFPALPIFRRGLTIAISLYKLQQNSFHLRTKDVPPDEEYMRYMYLNIDERGKYHVKSTWLEEEAKDFDNVIEKVKSFINPIIDSINGLGFSVFAEGNRLEHVAKKAVAYKTLTLALIWSQTLTEQNFASLASKLDIYARAGIITMPNKKGEAYEFMFKKGMVSNDWQTLASANGYAYLTDSVERGKWDKEHVGKLIRMVHRSSSVKFEIYDVDSTEFEIMRQYVSAIVYEWYKSDSFKKTSSDKKDYSKVKRLSKLKEIDPELYKVQKYGSKKLYSRRCQNSHQPLIYSDEELKKMSAADIKKLTKYWNFTTQTDAYYSCPNQKYGIFAFTTDIHPKGYCLPCCSKGRDNTSKKDVVISECMATHQYPQIENNSRLILQYGKYVEQYRIARVSEGPLKSMIGDDYYIYGVKQTNNSPFRLGTFFTLMDATGFSVDELVNKIDTWCRGPQFRTLFSGRVLNHYKTANRFIKSLRLVLSDDKFSILDNDPMFKEWAELAIVIAKDIFGIAVVLFDDEGTVEVQKDILERVIKYHANKWKDPIIDCSVLLMFKSTSLLQTSYNPIYQIDVPKYFKTGEIEKKLLEFDSEIVNTICMQLWTASSSEDSSNIYAEDLIEIARDNGWTPLKYVNLNNQIYCIAFKKASSLVHMPVEYVSQVSDGIEITYDPVTVCGSYEDSLQFISLLVPESVKITSYVKLRNGDVIGQILNNKYYMWFDAHGELDASIEYKIINYDWRTVNKSIVMREQPRSDELKDYGTAMYQNNIYKLFIVEFLNFLKSKRANNLTPRWKHICKVVAQSRGDGTSAIILALNQIDDLKIDVAIENDYNRIAYVVSSLNKDNASKEVILKTLAQMTFSFDVEMLHEYAATDQQTLVEKIRTDAAMFAVEAKIDGIVYMNVMLPCALDNTPSYCKKSKLAVGNLEEMITNLAEDLTNRFLSNYILSTIKGLINDPLDFNKRAVENLEILISNE